MQPIEDWFAQLPNEKRRPKPAEKEALKDFLLGHSSAEKAAARITSPTAEQDDVSPGLWDLWSFINDAAKQLPVVHGKLIDLLVAIKGLPDLKRGGRSVKIDNDLVVWKDLPLWASDIRERWYCEFYLFDRRCLCTSTYSPRRNND